MLLFLLFVLNYIRIYIRDHFNHWCTVLILMLPMRFFDQTQTVQIGLKFNIRYIWFAKVAIMFKGNPDIEYISGPQLLCLANGMGEIPINNLMKYFPNIQTLTLNYVTTKPTNSINDESSNSESESDSSDDESSDANHETLYKPHHDPFPDLKPDDLTLVTKVIDIETKKEVLTGAKCFLGRIQL